jgi:hypothetical protein
MIRRRRGQSARMEVRYRFDRARREISVRAECDSGLRAGVAYERVDFAAWQSFAARASEAAAAPGGPRIVFVAGCDGPTYRGAPSGRLPAGPDGPALQFSALEFGADGGLGEARRTSLEIPYWAFSPALEALLRSAEPAVEGAVYARAPEPRATASSARLDSTGRVDLVFAAQRQLEVTVSAPAGAARGEAWSDLASRMMRQSEPGGAGEAGGAGVPYFGEAIALALGGGVLHVAMGGRARRAASFCAEIPARSAASAFADIGAGLEQAGARV